MAWVCGGSDHPGFRRTGPWTESDAVGGRLKLVNFYVVSGSVLSCRYSSHNYEAVIPMQHRTGSGGK